MAAQYTSGAEYARHVAAKVALLLRDNKPLREAVYNDMAAKSVRIFENGEKSDGSQIGQYDSTHPMYVNPNFAPRKGAIRTEGGGKLQGLLPTHGKPTKDNPDGERFFKEKTKHRGIVRRKNKLDGSFVVVHTPNTGDPHRTTYLPGGYKELRNRTGRRIDRVNIRFTNDLFLDWANSPRAATPPSPTKINVHRYVIKLKRAHNVKKKDGLQDKYGKIFPSTKKERIDFLSDLQSRTNVFMRT